MLELGSSERRLTLGIFLAVFVHALILAIKIAVPKQEFQKDKRLTVSLVKEADDLPSNADEEQIVANQKVETKPDQQIEQVKVAAPITLITKEKSQVESAAATVKIHTYINSHSFQLFIETETSNHLEQNKKGVAEFSDTFSFPPAPKETPLEDQRKAVKLGSNAHIIEKDGKRFCVVRTQSLISSDALGQGSSLDVVKDCTPPKKFVLKGNQANNG